MKNNTEDFPNIFRMDDLFLFNGAFGADDAKKLAAYYHMDEPDAFKG